MTSSTSIFDRIDEHGLDTDRLSYRSGLRAISERNCDCRDKPGTSNCFYCCVAGAIVSLNGIEAFLQEALTRHQQLSNELCMAIRDRAETDADIRHLDEVSQRAATATIGSEWLQLAYDWYALPDTGDREALKYEVENSIWYGNALDKLFDKS
jgi:hypothetical protein